MNEENLDGNCGRTNSTRNSCRWKQRQNKTKRAVVASLSCPPGGAATENATNKGKISEKRKEDNNRLATRATTSS